jgi:hypothetical protein
MPSSYGPRGCAKGRTTSDAFNSFVHLRTGGFGWAEVVPDNSDPTEVWLTHRDGSGVCYTEADGHSQVRQRQAASTVG